MAAGTGPAALFWLAGFGQEPPDRLPLAAVPLLGAVLSGALTDLTAALRRRVALAWLAGSLAVGLLAAAATLGAPAAGAFYLLCPLTAVLLAAVLREARPPGLAPAVTVYVACTLLANFTLDSFLPLGGFFLVNVGTLFFGITFTQMRNTQILDRAVLKPIVTTNTALPSEAELDLLVALNTLKYTQSNSVCYAEDGQTVAAAMNDSALNLASAIGAWVGGLVLAQGFGYRAPAAVGAGLAVAGLLVFAVTMLVARRSGVVTTGRREQPVTIG